MYSADMKNAQLILGYHDVFTGEKPDLAVQIHSMNMHKAISIISELIQIRNAECAPVTALGLEITLPFETVLKRVYCGIGADSPEEMLRTPLLRTNQHILSLQMLLILLKKVIIYGDYQTLKDTAYEINAEDYRNIIMLQLLVADEISARHTREMDADHFLYSTYHLNYQRNVASEFLRMYYMMESLSTNPALFDEDIQAEYRDYYKAFTDRYGVTPTEYSSFLFWELQYYFSDKNALSHATCWRNTDSIYREAKEKAKISTVIDLLKAEPSRLREWAVQTENEEWDFVPFFAYPFLYDGASHYISISEITLINAFFEKIFWMIRECYSKEDSRAMAFFGRLFERYIQDATKDVCADSYTYIEEFSFRLRRNNRKSSDAYIRRGSSLLAVEAKGFSVLVDCMAKNERTEDNNSKLFVTPILQADTCLFHTLDTKKEFEGVTDIFLISVTLDNINAVPNYYHSIYQQIAEKKKCQQVHYYFNFSIEEYEMLLALIEKGTDIFALLREYFENKTLAPFGNFARDRIPDIGMTAFMERIYKEASDKMKRILWP